MESLSPRRCTLIDALKRHKVNAKPDSVVGQGEFTYCTTEVTKKPLNTSGTVDASVLHDLVQLFRVDEKHLAPPSSPSSSSHSGSESSIEDGCMYLFCALK